MVAIIGLTLPLFRLFAYDIWETLIRIIAFAVLALLFIFVGYRLPSISIANRVGPSYGT